MKNFTVILLVLILTFSLQAQTPKAELYVTTSYTVAIFPASYVIETNLDRFTPIRAEVDKGEKALSRDLFILNQKRENQTRDDLIHRRLLQYKRQYFGLKNEKGEKILKIVAYLKEENEDIEDSDFLVKERTILSGTNDNWVVYYNIDQNKLYDLAVGSKTEITGTVKDVKAADSVKVRNEPKKTKVLKKELGEKNISKD